MIVNSTRNYLLIFLALTTLGGAILAWNQHLELISLRAALFEKDLDTKRQLSDFRDKLAAARTAAAKANQDPKPTDNPPQGGRFGRWAARMNDPKFAAMMEAQHKAQISLAYGPLLKQFSQQLALTPAQLAAFQNLLAQKQNAARDVLAAAQQEGLSPRDPNDRTDINQLIHQSDAEIDSQIEAAVGPTAFAQYQQYEQTLPERNAVNQMQAAMINMGVPLTDSQQQQLISLLSDDAAKSYNPTSIRTLVRGPDFASPIPPQIIANPPTFLDSTQIPTFVNYGNSNPPPPSSGYGIATPKNNPASRNP